MTTKTNEKQQSLDDVLLQLFDALSPKGREIMLDCLRKAVERTQTLVADYRISNPEGGES